jgi:predicted enzyme related to lactoylglutathione lyase
VPCWADLTVPDVAAATAFYGSVVGWTFADTGDEYGGYTIAQVDDDAAAGIGPQAAAGVPPSWTLYFASDDVDATAAAITAGSGHLLLEPGDVGSLGRMCIGADPTGAVFGVWQAGEHIGAQVTGEPGGICWEDLRSTRPELAVGFYKAVFGLTTEGLEEAGPDYSLFFCHGTDGPQGGMGGMMGEPDGTPSHWIVYFAVADVDASIAAAVERGGSSLAPASDTPYGRMGPVADPWGAVFWVLQLPEEPEAAAG